MPVFHFTYHAYRSWNADHPRGWIQHGEPGIKRPSKDLAEHRARLAKHPEVRFKPEQQRAIVGYVREICERRNWTAYAVSADATHVHIVAAWNNRTETDVVKETFKRVIGYLLAKDAGTRGKPWFSHGQEKTPVKSRRHLRHLLYEYLPKHLGAYWRVELEH